MYLIRLPVLDELLVEELMAYVAGIGGVAHIFLHILISAPATRSHIDYLEFRKMGRFIETYIGILCRLIIEDRFIRIQIRKIYQGTGGESPSMLLFVILPSLRRIEFMGTQYQGFFKLRECPPEQDSPIISLAYLPLSVYQKEITLPSSRRPAIEKLEGIAPQRQLLLFVRSPLIHLSSE